MTNNYKKINFLIGWSIEDAVMELLSYKKKGELACGEFNGHMLYSDKVTVDGAYMEILGCTKAEHDRKQQEWRDNYDKELKEHEEQIPTLTEKWIEEGHEILDEKYWAKWDECVPIRLSDLYRGMELKCCLDIVKPLNEGRSLSEAKAIIESQNHSGMSFSLVRTMVNAFCDRGKEFAEYVD